MSSMAKKSPRNVSKKRRPFLNTSAMNNPKAFYKLNQKLRAQAHGAVKDIQDTEWADMRKKYFYLDHTQEVLENYRRLQENKIFDGILHDERMKKAYLRHEDRLSQNILLEAPKQTESLIGFVQDSLIFRSNHRM